MYSGAPSSIPGPNTVLGSTPSRPVREPHVSAVYGNRNASGLYESVADQIEAMGKDAMANIDYPDDFSRHIEQWSKNHRYVDKEGNELRTAIIGEILGPAKGTLVRAHGNYFAREGDEFRPIDDKAKVKDTLAIGIPTLSTTKLTNTFLNQIICATQITDANADEDMRNGRDPIVKSWTKASKDGSPNHDVMMVHMLPKYAVPSAAGAPKAKRVAKRKLDEVDEEAGPSDKPEPEIAIPSDIKLGAHYEPTLLPDYGGAYFNHIKAKLVQLDVRDVQNNLIAPWKYYEALRPGTLVLVLASLHCFSMMDDGGKERKERKIYQINAHSIKILSESDEPVEERTRPSPPNASDRAISKMPRAAAASFTNFSIPGTSVAQSSPSGSSTASGDSVSDDLGSGDDSGKGKSGKSKRARKE
ncbi:hypothetical protein B0H13DRAFT_1661360 [Mycena leptocephala]|nr:hypothetical protein B0H13DRAFT_1661360 [Mycena leptocephala]